MNVGFTELETSARGWIHKAGNRGYIKLVEDADRGVLVGASSAGPMGGEVLGLLTLAVHAEVPTETLRHMIYAYPTFHRAIEPALKDLASSSAGRDDRPARGPCTRPRPERLTRPPAGPSPARFSSTGWQRVSWNSSPSDRQAASTTKPHSTSSASSASGVNLVLISVSISSPSAKVRSRSRSADPDGLVGGGPQPHLDPVVVLVPPGHVVEPVEVEVGAEVAVEDGEHVAVERRRHPGGVVVGGGPGAPGP